MRNIIGIAAPARSGKDTVASIIRRHNNVTSYALADPLKIGCQALFGLSDEETWNDQLKEISLPLWNRSPREFFQQIGTEWMRAHNPEHWLMRAVRSISRSTEEGQVLFPAQFYHKKAPFHLAAQAFFKLSSQQTWDDSYCNIKDEFWDMTPKQMFDLIERLSIKTFPHYYNQRAKKRIYEPTRSIPFLGINSIIIIKDIRFENEADFLRKHNGQIWHIARDNAEKVNPHSSELGIKFNTKDIIINNNGNLEDLTITVEKAWQNYIKT